MDDYIPRKNAELAAWSINFALQVEANTAQWNEWGMLSEKNHYASLSWAGLNTSNWQT
jgi:hypothetical protein